MNNLSQYSDLDLLRELIRRNGHTEAATETKRYVPFRETLIAVGKDHTAEIIMCSETIDLLLKEQL